MTCTCGSTSFYPSGICRSCRARQAWREGRWDQPIWEVPTRQEAKDRILALVTEPHTQEWQSRWDEACRAWREAA